MRDKLKPGQKVVVCGEHVGTIIRENPGGTYQVMFTGRNRQGHFIGGKGGSTALAVNCEPV